MAGLTRRQVLASSLVAPLFGARSASAQDIAPLRNRLTFGFRSAEMRVATVTEEMTFFVTAPFEAPPTAIRIGFGNTTGVPYRISGACCCEGNGWQPKAGAPWSYLSFYNDGKQDVKQPAARPQACVVPGNLSDGATAQGLLDIHWSDWISYRTQSRQRPQMLFRILVPQQQLPLNYWISAGNVGRWVPGSPVRLIEVRGVAGDQITDPGTMPLPVPQQVATAPPQLSPLYVVQYLTATPGLQIVMGGDSHLTAYNTFAFLAAIELSTPALPISFWNVAWTGKPSGVFSPILDAAVREAEPSITVIEGWSANDGMRAAPDQAYLARVREIAAHTQREGGVPIILKGMPRHLFGTPELASWQRVNRELAGLVPGARVFDPLPFIEDPDRPGDWRRGMSDDQIHPNGLANATLRGPFEAALRQLMP